MTKYIDGLKRATEYTYDISGNLIKEKDYRGSVYEYGYDALSRLISEKDPLGKSIFYEYDKAGNLWKVTDRNGNVTSYFYDKAGNLTRTEDAMGNVTILEYDSMNRVKTAKVQRGEGEEEEDFDITRYEYDKRGLVAKEINPLGYEKSYTYDEAGNLVISVNEEGEETSFTYNYMNLLETAVYPGGESVSYKYDSFGNMTGATNSRGTVSIARDYFGRITGVKDENGKKVGYSYDDLGNLTEITYPDGETTRYSYDEEGRLKEVKDSILGSFTIIHDDKAGTLTKNYSNGEKTVYTFDKAGNVTGLKEYLKDKSLYMDIEYGYDHNGNRTKEKYNVFEGEKGKEGKAAKENTYVYDSLNRLFASVLDKEVTVYHYDKLSNIVMEDKDNEITKYEYNKLNQLVSKKGKEGVTSYTYDKLGNRIREEGSLGIKEYTYDSMGNLTQGTNQKGELSIYEYSPLGMRTKEISITKGEDGKEKKVTTTYVVDYLGSESNDLVSYTRGGGGTVISEVATRYTYAGGERIGQTVKENQRFLLVVMTLRTTKYNIHEDIMGSVRYITNYEDGKVYQNIEYDPWGRPTVKGDRENRYFEVNYTGHSYDEILGIYYAQARFYDPVNKVFTSMDPAGYGANWYSYCSGNPVTYYDPTGLFDEQTFYEQEGEELGMILSNPLLREELFVGVGAMALGLIIGAVVPGAMMLIVGAVITAAQYGINYILETEASGDFFSDKEFNKRILRGGVEGLIMGAGGLACVKAAETFKILKPIEDCAAKAKKISNVAKNEAKEIENTVQDARAIGESEVDAVNLAKRWAINGIGNGVTGVVSEYVGGLIEGKSSKEAFREAMNNAPQIMFTSIFMATADTMVQLHVSSQCFVEDTPVLTEEGNVNIQEIEEGDLVFAYDEETGETGYKEVVRLFRNKADELVHITIVTEDGRKETITSTLEHPYYVKTEDAFINAEDLEEGTILMLADGTTATVVKVTIENLETPVTVYNFEVKDFHTYYVGDNSVLVHNMCGTGEVGENNEQSKPNGNENGNRGNGQRQDPGNEEYQRADSKNLCIDFNEIDALEEEIHTPIELKDPADEDFVINRAGLIIEKGRDVTKQKIEITRQAIKKVYKKLGIEDGNYGVDGVIFLDPEKENPGIDKEILTQLKGAYACCDEEGAILYINANKPFVNEFDWFGLIRRDIAPRSFEECIFHEMGHSTHFRNQGRLEVIYREISEKLQGKYVMPIDFDKWLRSSRTYYGERISKYASEGNPLMTEENIDKEYFAESFVLYMRGETKKLDPIFVDLMDKLKRRNQ